MRVLIIEDDAAVLDALREVLEDEGHEVLVAANGREALSRLRSGNRPDLILLDLMMPVMSGWEFREAQLQDETLAAIPTVILTALGSAAQRALELQSAGFLQKPIQPDRLLQKVDEICHRELPS
ncbi:MAG TPA: response regulator [Thermoanaerobaculia bacterium]|nr:response regulator [Thermoanaerobaculia bacterium]